MTEKCSESSFNRLGDDLSQIILSELPFEDRIRMECMSSQFSQLVYEKQLTLEINKILFEKLRKINSIDQVKFDLKSYKVFIKKLSNLKTLYIEYNTFWFEFSKFLELIEITLKYCQLLDEINIIFVHITDIQANEFFKKFGHKIKRITFSFDENFMHDKSVCLVNLIYCSYLKEIDLGYIKHLFHGKNNCLVRSLNKLRFAFTNFQEDQKYFKSFVETNKNNLKCLEVFLPKNIEATPLMFLFKQITKLKNLTALKITFVKYFEQDLPSFLNEIAENCRNINDLDIRFATNFFNTENLLKSIEKFKNLSKLSIYLVLNQDQSDNLVQYLIKCQNLQEINLVTAGSTLQDNILFEIHKNLPKIQELWINDTDMSFTEISPKYLLFKHHPAIINEGIINCKDNLKKLTIDEIPMHASCNLKI